MNRFAKLGTSALLLALAGCHARYTPPEQPLPPNTVLLSQMLRELSAQPGFTESVLKQIEGPQASNTKHGPALLTPALVDDLRKRIVGKDWTGLDRFPGWTMSAINPTVRVAGHVAGKNEFLEAETAAHPGATPIAAATHEFLDVGPYALDRRESISLEQPSTMPGFSTKGIVTDLGAGVTRGDGPNALATEHAESQRLADALNRLAANALDGAQPLWITKSWKTLGAEISSDPNHHVPVVYKAKLWSATPDEVIRDLQASGQTVTVTDSRYFANFGHFHFRGQDVMMPFWVNTQIAIPGSGGLLHKARPLLVPVSHAELEWHVRGPALNVDVSWYFGIDGKAEWRVMDTLDQPWVGKRDAHVYTGAQAVEATRLAAAFTVAYMHLHARYPRLPFGGYYALGVCQDSVSAIEHKLTGSSTLFPNTADGALFNDPRDAEANALIAVIPKDREGHTPEPERIFGSLPLSPAADEAHAFDAVAIPGLAADLNATYTAWHHGKLEHTRNPLLYLVISLALAGVLGVLLALRRRTK